MKKSILSFGGIMFLLLLVFACTQEQENIKIPENPVRLKSTKHNASNIAYRTDRVNVTTLLVSLRNYITEALDKNHISYGLIPERKNAAWFHENFDYIFKKSTETNKWVKKNIDFWSNR